jgi:predicted enzyme related to lactoylglutathione lyase
MRYKTSKAGMITWHDLTVENAEEVRDFYQRVVGWKPQDVQVEDYSDYNMTDPRSGESVAGVCHKKGPNKSLPSQWLMYITVSDINESVETAEKHGGKVIKRIEDMGSGKYAIVQDPAGAVFALYEEAG